MSKSQKRKKTFRHASSFDDAENLLFQQNFIAWKSSTQADDYGDSEAAFIRYATIGKGLPKLRKKRRIVGRHKLPAEQLLLQLKAEVNRVGNNINQIAYQLNAGGNPSTKQIQSALTDWNAVAQSINQQLGIDPNKP